AHGQGLPALVLELRRLGLELVELQLDPLAAGSHVGHAPADLLQQLELPLVGVVQSLPRILHLVQGLVGLGLEDHGKSLHHAHARRPSPSEDRAWLCPAVSAPRRRRAPPDFTLRITHEGVTKLHSGRLGGVFRRRTRTPADDSPVAAEDPKPLKKTQGKGRPTPKRRDAEGRRRTPVAAPVNRKEAYRRYRERVKAEQARRREAMLRREEWALPARDRGPVRRFARDWVDSRRLPGQYFLPVVLFIMVLSLIPFP